MKLIPPEAEHPVPNILVVDDTPANLQLLTGMLKKHGYRVRPVPSGKLAIQAIQNEKPDLILLDIPNYRYLPYHFGVDHVELVIKNGKVVYRNQFSVKSKQ